MVLAQGNGGLSLRKAGWPSRLMAWKPRSWTGPPAPEANEHSEWVFVEARAAMPGDALLFRGLSHSTIGAVRFHGRVRDGIGWVTDAMVTKQ